MIKPGLPRRHTLHALYLPAARAGGTNCFLIEHNAHRTLSRLAVHTEPPGKARHIVGAASRYSDRRALLLRAGQLLVIEATRDLLAIDVEDAMTLAEGTEI